MSTMPEAALLTQTVGRGEGEGVDAIDSEYDAVGLIDAIGLLDAISDADTEGVDPTDFVRDGDPEGEATERLLDAEIEEEAIRLRDSDTERLTDADPDGDMLPIIPTKL